MELIALKTFKAVVDHGGIKPAAQQLHTVQSNVTNRIQKLEQELDSKLFQLVGRKLELTPQGHKLYDYAANILQMEQQAVRALAGHDDDYYLRVGMPETFEAVHFPLVLKRLKQNHPEIHPRIHTETSERLLADLLLNKIDCALAGNAPQRDDLMVVPVVREDLVMVKPADGQHDDLLLVREEGCGYRKHALIWQQRFQDNEEHMVISSSEGLLGCIAAGLGYTIIGKDMVVGSRYEDALQYEQVDSGQQYVQISMVYRANHPLRPGIESLAQLFPQYQQYN